MKKLTHFLMVCVTILASLLVYNLFETRDYQQLQNLGAMSGITQKFYLTQTNKTVEEHLAFLEEISQKYRVSIIRTDNTNGTIVKSLLIYPSTFPEYFIPSEQTIDLQDGFYANFSSHDKQQKVRIPAFSSQNKLILQSLSAYYEDISHPILGTYLLISTEAFDTDKVMSEVSNFYQVDKDILLTTTSFSGISLINRYLILYVVLLGISFLLILVMTVSSAVADIHSFGVMKLNGLSNIRILYSRIRFNLMLLFLSSIIINLYWYLSIEQAPSGFFPVLLIAQCLTILYYLTINGLTYLLLSQVRINQLLKRFVDFKLGVILLYGLKTLVFLVMGYMIVNASSVVMDLYHQQETYSSWKEYHNYATVEYFNLTDEGEVALATNTDSGIRDLFHLYNQLEKEVPILYTYYDRFEQGQVLTDAKGEELYHFQDDLDLLTVNQNYLQKLNLSHLVTNQQNSSRVLLVPESMRNTNLTLAFQAILYNLYSVAEQEKLQATAIPFQIIYYADRIDTFSFNAEKKSMLRNPVFMLVDADTMLWFEKVRLSNTQLENPMKIPANKKELDRAERIIKNESKVYIPKFTKIKDLLDRDFQFHQFTLSILFGLVLLIFSMDIFVSFALNTIIFHTERNKIAIKKLLGFTFLDRYKKHILAIGAIDTLVLVLVCFFEKTVLMFPVLLLLLSIDAVLSVKNIRKIETQQLASLLKEG